MNVTTQTSLAELDKILSGVDQGILYIKYHTGTYICEIEGSDYSRATGDTMEEAINNCIDNLSE